MPAADRYRLTEGGILIADTGIRSEERKRAPRATPRRVIKNLPLTQSLRRIGGNITPERVTQYLREADSGYIYNFIDLSNEARQKDTHLHAVLAVREDQLAGLEWTITEPPSANADEKRATEFVTEVFRHLDQDTGADSEALSFGGLVEHLQVANYHGFSAAEVQWGRDSQYLVPAFLWQIAHRRFRYRDADGKLVHQDEDQTVGVDLLRDFPRGNFIQHQPRVIGDVKVREGLARILIWPALFCNWDIKDWMLLAEIGWKPWREGAYSKNAPSHEIDELIEALEEMSSSSILVHSKDDEVEIHWPKSTSTGGGQSSHKELHSYLCRQMSKAVLGATDVIESDENGARSAVQERGKRPQEKLEKDARACSRTIRAQLIEPLVRYNPFPAGTRLPTFAFATRQAVDAKSFSETVKNFVTSGVPISKSWVYDELGGGKPIDEDDTIKPILKPAATGDDGAKPSDDSADDAGSNDEIPEPGKS
jgi:phage gp29-like protein